MPRKNHLSQRHRMRALRRVRAMVTLRCANCRRRLDAAFTWDKARLTACCSRCRSRSIL